MSQSHAEKLLDQLHDQFLKGIDCDVILRSADHLGGNSVTSNPDQGFDIRVYFFYDESSIIWNEMLKKYLSNGFPLNVARPKNVAIFSF